MDKNMENDMETGIIQGFQKKAYNVLESILVETTICKPVSELLVSP